MVSAGNDESDRPAPGDGDGGGGDWTNWLRNRLERVAAPERRQDVAADDEPKSGQHRAGAPPAPRLPPSGQEAGADLGLGVQWPSRRLEPSAGARGVSADDRGAGAETAGSDPPVAPGPPEAPPARPDALAPGPQGAGDERPASSREAAPAGFEATTAPPGARAPSRLAEPPPAVPSHELVAGLDRLQVAVSSLSARVDGLADATHTFRSVMNERLDEYTETVLRAAKSSASDVQEYRRMHTASLGEVRRNANETAETLRRLTGWMEELARIQGDDERWATALSQAFEEAAAERREGEERDHQVVSTLTERLKRIDQALGRLGEELAAEPPDPLLPVVTSLAERLERMEQALDELAAQAGQPLLPPVIDTLVERLEAIERAVAARGEEPAALPPAPLVLDDDAVRAIAAAVAERLDVPAIAAGAERLDAPPPAAAPEPQPTTTETTERTETTSPTSPPDAAPAATARGRRTTPIRARSRSRSSR